MIANPEPDALPPRIRFELAPQTIPAVVLTAAGLWLLIQLWPILLVIVFSLILVGTLNPIVGWLQARPMKRGWAVALVFLFCALLLGLLGLIIIPPLLDQVAQLVRNFPAIEAK